MEREIQRVRRTQAALAKARSVCSGDYLDRLDWQNVATYLTGLYFPKSKKNSIRFEEYSKLFRAALLLYPLQWKLKGTYKPDYHIGTVLSFFRRVCNIHTKQRYLHHFCIREPFKRDIVRCNLQTRLKVTLCKEIEEALEIAESFLQTDGIKYNLASLIFSPVAFCHLDDYHNQLWSFTARAEARRRFRATGQGTVSYLRNLADIEEFAQYLLPERHENDDNFFEDAARSCIAAMILALKERADRKNGRWGFRDIILGLSRIDYFYTLLRQTETGKHLIQTYFNEKHQKLMVSVFSSTEKVVRNFNAIASAWSHAEERCSLRDWADNGGILIIGHHENYASKMKNLNRFLLARTLSLALAKEETSYGHRDDYHSYFFLDEMIGLGKIPRLGDGLRELRSKGGCIVMGVQNVSDLNHIYGRDAATALLGQCGNSAFLMLNDDRTAEWAARQFGRYRVEIDTPTYGRHGVTSRRKSYDMRDSVLSKEFLEMQAPGGYRERPLVGYYKTMQIRNGYRYEMPWNVIKDEIVPPYREDIAGQIERDSHELTLKGWSDGERNFFGVSDSHIYEAKKASHKESKQAGHTENGRIMTLDDLINIGPLGIGGKKAYHKKNFRKGRKPNKHRQPEMTDT